MCWLFWGWVRRYLLYMKFSNIKCDRNDTLYRNIKCDMNISGGWGISWSNWSDDGSVSLCCACGRRSRLVTASKQLWQHVAGNDGSHRIPPLYLVILTSMEAVEIFLDYVVVTEMKTRHKLWRHNIGLHSHHVLFYVSKIMWSLWFWYILKFYRKYINDRL